MSLKASPPQLRILHYLFSDSHGKTIAHCLDLDLVVTGASLEEADTRLDGLVRSHVEMSLQTGNLANLATPAPSSYWKKFAEGIPLDFGSNTLELSVPEIVPLANTQSHLEILARQLANAA